MVPIINFVAQSNLPAEQVHKFTKLQVKKKIEQLTTLNDRMLITYTAVKYNLPNAGELVNAQVAKRKV